MSTTTAGPSLAARVADLQWYHTFDLPGGVTTPGFYDHREIVHRLPIPEDLTGTRCVDLASADGFFAFEMARRGATEVVSVDLADPGEGDWQGDPPPDVRHATAGRARKAFDLVRETTGLDVQRVDLSLYDLSPDALGGTFDFVFMGNVLLHLRDPERALTRVRSVTGGRFLSFEMISLPLTLTRPLTPTAHLWDGDEARWWTPNVAAHRRLLRSAGFRIVDAKWPMYQPFGDHLARWPKRPPRRLREWIYWGWIRRMGAATTWSLCEPGAR